MAEPIEALVSIESLPKICIYSLDEDSYSQFYDVDEICVCGNAKWYNSLISISSQDEQLKLTPKRIHRCSACNEMRLSRLKKKIEKILTTSIKLLETLKKANNDDHELFAIIGNIYARLGISLHGEKDFQDILTSMKKIQHQ